MGKILLRLPKLLFCIMTLKSILLQLQLSGVNDLRAIAPRIGRVHEPDFLAMMCLSTRWDICVMNRASDNCVCAHTKWSHETVVIQLNCIEFKSNKIYLINNRFESSYRMQHCRCRCRMSAPNFKTTAEI